MEIINGYNAKNTVDADSLNIIETKTLQNSHVKDGKKSFETFTRLGNESIFKNYAEGKDMDGLHDLRNSVAPMLDYIFLTGNKSPAIDIFCTHDFQMSQFLLFLWDCGREIKEKTLEKWPRMLEALFLWGERNHFTAVWRGEKKEIML
jgi:hypothetical protein